MSAPRLNPPFRAEVVGSLLRPAAVHEARVNWQGGRLDAQALRAIENHAVGEAVAMQKAVGLKVCTDGEFHRRHWFLDFIERIDGVTISGTMAGKFISGLRVVRCPDASALKRSTRCSPSRPR